MNKKELVQFILRKIHTIKGNAGFMGFANIEKLTHKMESLLNIAIDLNDFDSDTAKIFLTLNDVLEAALEDIKKKSEGRIPQLDLYVSLIDDIILGLENKPRTPKVGEILEKSGIVDKETIEMAVSFQQKPVGEILIDLGAVTKNEVEQALKIQNESKDKPVLPEIKDKKSVAQKQDMRVDITKLDALADLIGELVVANNMIFQSIPKDDKSNRNLMKSAQHLGKIVRDLQEIAMVIRMIPANGLFRKMSRLVYDLCQRSGKDAELLIFGEETEIDKTVIEIITDPLVHILRNAVDHGIEKSDKRKATGKLEKGTIKLSANNEEGEIKIVIEDDGQGINKDKVLKKAIQNKLIPENKELSESEIFSLIFEPGFSTADAVSEISGRGVGMDVVKRNMESISGSISVESKAGAGTKITLKIPLTLAIIEGMLVRAGDTFFTIPLMAIKELFKPRSEKIIKTPDGTESVRLRDEIIPVIRLYEKYDIVPQAADITDGMFLIIDNGRDRKALFVDKVIGQQQTVIKPLPESMQKVRGICGCAILGDGKISMILDPSKLNTDFKGVDYE